MKDNISKTRLPYPYLTYSRNVEVFPLFEGLKGDPFITDLSETSPVFDEVDILNQEQFQAWLDQRMAKTFTWGVASYLENRKKVLSNYPQMVEEQRYFHLGLDIIVPLGTPLHAPLDAIVEASGYEPGDGNYGGHVLLRHESSYFEPFFSIYGHLNREKLPGTGDVFKGGDVFACIGDFHENGNWFYHTHLQVITQQGLDSGYQSKGYCSSQDFPDIDRLCPSPLPLFRI